MAKQWYFVKDGKPQGPISALELKQKADSGELRSEDLVCPEDHEDWVKAAAVKGLFAAKVVTPPPLPHSPTTPQPLPTSSVPPPFPTVTATSQADSSHPSNFTQSKVRPFGEWYRAGWLGRKPLAVQFIIWAVFGFVWIPYWYFWMATPPGSLRGKWTSLATGSKLGCVLLTISLCVIVVRFLPNQHTDAARLGQPKLARATQGDSANQPVLSTVGDVSPSVAEEVPNERRLQNLFKRFADVTPSDLDAKIDVPEFLRSQYEYDYSTNNYELIPSGSTRKTLTRRIPPKQGWPEDLVDMPSEEEGYIGSDGKFVNHGHTTIYAKHAEGSLKAEYKTFKYADAMCLNGKLHGLCTTYYPEGQKKVVIPFVKGKTYGIVKKWWPDGSPISEVAYIDDQKHGHEVTWYDNGNREYDKTYVCGKLHGLWKEWYKNGSPSNLIFFDKGVQVGLRLRWYQEGQLALVVSFRSGKVEGPCVRYCKNGRILRELSYKNGECDYHQGDSVNMFVAKIQEALGGSDWCFPYDLVHKWNEDRFARIFAKPSFAKDSSGRQHRLYVCKDGEVEFVEDGSWGGNFVIRRSSPPITQNLRKQDFINKLRTYGESSSEGRCCTAENFFGEFGDPSDDTFVATDPTKHGQRVFVYQCADGKCVLLVNVMFTNKERGEILNITHVE